MRIALLLDVVVGGIHDYGGPEGRMKGRVVRGQKLRIWCETGWVAGESRVQANAGRRAAPQPAR